MIRPSLRIRLLHVPSADWDLRLVRAALLDRPPDDAVRAFEAMAGEQLGGPCVAFGSARSGLAVALATLDPQPPRVFIPAFTCVAVPNAVAAAGLPIEWVDVDGPNLDVAAVVSRARAGDAVIAQHTYGIPIDSAVLDDLVDRGMTVIEDRAHRFDGQDIRAHATVFSMEHSKVVSSALGGLVFSRDPAFVARLTAGRSAAPPIDPGVERRAIATSVSQVVAATLSPTLGPLSSLVRRAMLRVPWLSTPGQTLDEIGGSAVEPRAMTPRLANIGRLALTRLALNLAHRRAIVNLYRARLGELVPAWADVDRPLVRLPLVVEDADRVTARLRRLGFSLGQRWFDAPVHPSGSASTYQPGTAPNAERLARTVLSLPTHARVTAEVAEELALAIRRAVG